jgi:hypothetical protein
LVEYATCETVMVFIDTTADVSLPVIRVRSRPGIAKAAMMLMMATTMSNSMSVKPRSDLDAMEILDAKSLP